MTKVVGAATDGAVKTLPSQGDSGGTGLLLQVTCGGALPFSDWTEKETACPEATRLVPGVTLHGVTPELPVMNRSAGNAAPVAVGDGVVGNMMVGRPGNTVDWNCVFSCGTT